jgi:hypothetical protein
LGDFYPPGAIQIVNLVTESIGLEVVRRDTARAHRRAEIDIRIASGEILQLANLARRVKR